MLRTDLDGFIAQAKESPVAKLAILIIILIILYCLVSEYLSSNGSGKNNFANVMILRGDGNGYNGNIPKIDEAIIRNHISLPNRDPRMLTTSMVIPEPTIKEETKKQTRMEILNMFYNTFGDDSVSVSSRPQGLYVIP